MITWTFSDQKLGNGNNILDRGESFEVTMHWKNFLAATKNAIITLSSSNPRISITNPEFHVGVLDTDQEISNETAPFIRTIADEEALNDQIDLFFTIQDDAYSDYGGVTMYQQPTYRDHTANKIMTTLSNDGNVGYDDFSGSRGSGFIYDNNTFNILFEGALMIGAVLNKVPLIVDVARNETQSEQNADFIGSSPVVMETPGAVAAQEGFTEFTDAGAPLSNLLGLDIKLHSYEFTESNYDNFLILKYTIRNTSSNTLDSLHAGLFFDWDMGDAFNDYTEFDTTTQTGYAYNKKGAVPTYVGVTVLTRNKPTHFMAINNPDPDDKPPLFGIHNGFSKDEKWRAMTSGILQRQSTITDISQVIANGPYRLQPGEDVTIAFAIIGGLSKNGILTTTPKIIEKWNLINQPTSVENIFSQPCLATLFPNYPNPVQAGQTTLLRFNLTKRASVRLDIIDALGRIVHTITEADFDAGTHLQSFHNTDLPAGIYLVRMIANGFTVLRNMTILR